METTDAPDEGEEICRPFITLKNGRRIFAAHYGKQAFCFRVKSKKAQPKSDD